MHLFLWVWEFFGWLYFVLFLFIVVYLFLLVWMLIFHPPSNPRLPFLDVVAEWVAKIKGARPYHRIRTYLPSVTFSVSIVSSDISFLTYSQCVFVPHNWPYVKWLSVASCVMQQLLHTSCTRTSLRLLDGSRCTPGTSVAANLCLYLEPATGRTLAIIWPKDRWYKNWPQMRWYTIWNSLGTW